MARIKASDRQQPAATADGGGEGVALAASVAAHVETLPNQEPNGAFFLAFSPFSWQVLDSKVVPAPRKIDVSPGVNGTGRVGVDGVSIADAKTAQEERGRFVLLPDPSKPHTDYLRRYRVAGGWYHCERWGRPIPGTAAHRVDVAGYAAWLASLIADGHVPGPSAEALGMLLSSLTDQREAHSRARNSERVARLTADIAVVEKAIGGLAVDGADGEGVTL